MVVINCAHVTAKLMTGSGPTAAANLEGLLPLVSFGHHQWHQTLRLFRSEGAIHAILYL